MLNNDIDRQLQNPKNRWITKLNTQEPNSIRDFCQKYADWQGIPVEEVWHANSYDIESTILDAIVALEERVRRLDDNYR